MPYHTETERVNCNIEILTKDPSVHSFKLAIFAPLHSETISEDNPCKFF